MSEWIGPLLGLPVALLAAAITMRLTGGLFEALARRSEERIRRENAEIEAEMRAERGDL